MPSHFIHSIQIQREALAVSTLRSVDLPINPISHILLHVRCLNDMGTAALRLNHRALNQMLALITRVEVLYRGSAIISASLTDLAVAYMILTGRQIWQGQIDATDNNRRDVTIPIPLGRRLFDRSECFPATRKGELQLQITSGAAVAGLDTLVIEVETVELVDASPQRYLKMTTATKTPSAVQEEDLELPIGNLVAGVLLFGTTAPNAGGVSATSFSIQDVQMLVNNVQRYFPRSDYEALHGALTQRLDPLIHNSHSHPIHRTATAGLATGAVTIADGVAGEVTGGVGATGAASNVTGRLSGNLDQVVPDDFMENYIYLDLDPTGDLSYSQDTLGLSRFHLRINHGVVDAIRSIPIELVRV